SPALVILSPSRMTPSRNGFETPAAAFADESAASSTIEPALPSSLTANSGPYRSLSYSARSAFDLIAAVIVHLAIGSALASDRVITPATNSDFDSTKTPRCRKPFAASCIQHRIREMCVSGKILVDLESILR